MKCFTLLDDKDANFHLDRKKVIQYFPTHIAGRHVPCIALQLTWNRLPFKQLNWRIRENLSQAINNGSWYKLSLLVSEDAMIVPATCIYSVWRFAQNSWDKSPWNKHHYFRFYKLGVSKVINRRILSCTPLTTVNHESRFEEIISISIKCFVINRRIGLEGVEKNKGWAQQIRKPQSPYRGALKLRANAPP